MAKAAQPEPEFYSGKLLYTAIAALVALSGLFGLFVLPRLAPPGHELIAKTAPDFVLPTVANSRGAERIALSELQGKVVVLDFWATWCGPCRAQAPILDQLARQYEGEVEVLGINVGEPPARARAYAKQKGLAYPILADTDGKAQNLYGASTLPTIVVIDRQGQIASFSRGLVRKASLERTIRANM